MNDNFKKRVDRYIEESKTNNYIPTNKCKNGYLYRIHARNANFGIFNETSKAFIIRRIKFSWIYLFEEIHWDESEHFGTVKPIKKIEKSPFKIEKRLYDFYKEDNSSMLEYLKKFEDEYEKELEQL